MGACSYSRDDFRNSIDSVWEVISSDFIMLLRKHHVVMIGS